MGTQLHPPPTERGTAARPLSFRPMSTVAKSVGCIKVPLATEIGRGPGDIVLDGDPAPPRKGAQSVYAVSAIFLFPVSAYLLVGRC